MSNPIGRGVSVTIPLKGLPRGIDENSKAVLSRLGGLLMLSIFIIWCIIAIFIGDAGIKFLGVDYYSIFLMALMTPLPIYAIYVFIKNRRVSLIKSLRQNKKDFVIPIGSSNFQMTIRQLIFGYLSFLGFFASFLFVATIVFKFIIGDGMALNFARSIITFVIVLITYVPIVTWIYILLGKGGEG